MKKIAFLKQLEKLLDTHLWNYKINEKKSTAKKLLIK